MKSKAILVSFIAIFAIIFTLSMVMASEFADDIMVEVNDVTLTTGPTYIGQVSDTVPVRVEFSGMQDINEEVKVKAYIEGYKNEIYDTFTMRTPIECGVNGYVARLSLEFPSSMDLDDLSEDLTLWIRFIAKGEESFEIPYTIRMQKDLYSLNVLSIDAPSTVSSGSVVAFDVVLENNGNEELENVYVQVSIPELGLGKKVYFGDIEPQDEVDYAECSWEYCKDLDREDTVNKKVYLSVPRTAVPGIYEVVIEAYNRDTEEITKGSIVVSGAEADVLATTTSKTISIGEETTFDIPLVNYGDRMVVYSITPEESTGLIVEIEEPVISVSGDSSRIVKVNVRATQSAEEGTHLVTINVNSESGLVKQVTFSVNVEEEDTVRKADSVLILTVILAIIFVVLLIVLIVLLTKKPAEVEDFSEEGETSYY